MLFFSLILGLQIHDTCNSEDLTQKHLYNVISTTQDLERALGIQGKGPPLLGKIKLGTLLSLLLIIPKQINRR